MKLELNHLSAYLEHDLKGQIQYDMKEEFSSNDWVDNLSIFENGSIWTYSGYADDDLLIPLGDGDFSGFLIRHGNSYISVGKGVKPMLIPLSYFKGRRRAKDVMEELQCDVRVVQELWELENGLKTLEEIRFKTYNVMCKNHIDFNKLIEKGLAVNKKTLN